MAKETVHHPSSQFGAPVICMRHIHKNFKNVQALKAVEFQLAAGEIRGLVGENGIGMIHQHFSSVPVYSVLQNVVLPTLKWRDFRPDWAACEKKITDLAREYDFQLDMRSKVDSLSVGEKQQVEILKALYQGARMMIERDYISAVESSRPPHTCNRYWNWSN